MPGTTFPPHVPILGFRRCVNGEWMSRRSPAAKPLNCINASSPNEGIFPLGRRSRSNNESAAHEQCIAKTHGIGGMN